MGGEIIVTFKTQQRVSHCGSHILEKLKFANLNVVGMKAAPTSDVLGKQIQSVHSTKHSYIHTLITCNDSLQTWASCKKF